MDEELKEFIEGCFEDLKCALKKNIDLKIPKLEEILSNIENRLNIFFKNAEKFDVMMKEMNGLVIRTRALFEEKKTQTPYWYDINKVFPPEKGEIWVKDIEGTETIAVCKGKAIIYPANSDMKIPEFWKPI